MHRSDYFPPSRNPFLSDEFLRRDSKRHVSDGTLSLLAVFFLGGQLRIVVLANPPLPPKGAFWSPPCPALNPDLCSEIHGLWLTSAKNQTEGEW